MYYLQTWDLPFEQSEICHIRTEFGGVQTSSLHLHTNTSCST